MKNINYIESLNVSAPGLIDPGIIILGKSVQTVGTYSTYIEFEEDPYIQYKASTNKFLGYIGDLAEYKFKHIPEKQYYNNISILELLNKKDQEYIGTKLPTLDAISKYAVLTELVKDNYQDSASIPENNYDKFKPRYFGTAIVEDKTVMLFMVPPGYNTIFVSNGSGIYSKDEVLELYGPQDLIPNDLVELYDNIPYSYSPADNATGVELPVKLSWRCRKTDEVRFKIYIRENGEEGWIRDPYSTAASHITVSDNIRTGTTYQWKVEVWKKEEDRKIYDGRTLTFTTKRVSMNSPHGSPSSTFPGGIDGRPVGTREYENLSENAANVINSQTSSGDTTSQPTTDRGRGNENNRTPPTITALDDYYSLVVNVETGMSVVVSNSDLKVEESAEINPNILLYAFEFSDSPYSFKPLQEYSYYVKMKTSYYWYHKLREGVEYDIAINPSDPNTSPESGLKNFLEGTINNHSVFEILDKQRIGTHVNSNTGHVYTSYLAYVYVYLDKSQTNLYGVTKYIKKEEKESYKLFKEIDEYDEKDIKGYQVIRFDWDETIYGNNKENNVSNLSEGCCVIIDAGGLLTKGPNSEEDKWYIKDYKEDLSESPFGNIDTRAGNIDTEGISGNFPMIDDWQSLYGLANYYEYIKGASQLEVHLTDEYEDYYKLVKLVISPNEGRILILKKIDNSDSNISVNIGDIIKVEDKYYSLTENLTLVETFAEESNHTLNIGSEVILGGNNYILQYSPNSSSVESLNIVNLGYKTSENPLKNLDKYLVRDTNFVKKYSTLNSNIVDLTSGSYLSTGIREKESDTDLNLIKYSYRKKYRKGQSVLMGLPENLEPTIIDINRIIPSIWTEEEGDIRVPEIILGDIVYDYNSGIICKITRDNNNYIIDSTPYTEDYLYRYNNEYYLYRNEELIRTGKLGIRTWTSLCDDNKGNFPGMSRSWMSSDGYLSREDKVWVIIISSEGRKKVLGEIVRKRVEGIEVEGVCLRLMTGYLGKTVTLNGVQVAVESIELPEEGVMRDFQDLYLVRQVRKVVGDVVIETRAVADITNNLVFKGKINYVIT